MAMYRWTALPLPRLSVIGRGLVATVGVVALLGAAVGVAAGVSASPNATTGGAVYVALYPKRILDTRAAYGPIGITTGALKPYKPKTLQVTNRFPPT